MVFERYFISGGGAAGRVDSSSASAELEGDESELVTIDSPVAPQCDIYAMLHCVSSNYINNDFKVNLVLSIIQCFYVSFPIFRFLI